MTYEKYHELKSKGLCPRCGKKPERSVLCESCKIKQRKYKYDSIMKMNEEEYTEHVKYDRANHKYLYELRKKEGICVSCGKVKVRDNRFVNCCFCRKRRTQKAKTLRDRKRTEPY